jgi:metal-responsive CopG/Arc/MetJ family transcriptional regulator
MKPVQVMLDEGLLRRLDADPEVKKAGRSAVLRRAAELYLRRSAASRIKAAYERGYAKGDPVAEEFPDWGREAAWPEK